jgi:hypothetical protein
MLKGSFFLVCLFYIFLIRLFHFLSHFIRLGRVYERGLGVVQSYDEAIKWYKLASETEHAEAKIPIGQAEAINHLGSNI